MDRADFGRDLDVRLGHREMPGQNLARLHEVDRNRPMRGVAHARGPASASFSRRTCAGSTRPPAIKSIMNNGNLHKLHAERRGLVESRRNCSKLRSSEIQLEKPAPRTAAIALTSLLLAPRQTTSVIPMSPPFPPGVLI